jgi:DNA polymerase III epsilon subunit family exonuclease
LLDDKVVAYVVASLALMSRPGDVNAIEAFGERMLPRHMLEAVRAGVSPNTDLLTALRAFARTHPRGDPDTKKAWRFIFHVENLNALWRAHDTLPALVEELLAHRTGPIRNPLEERADELTDPGSLTGANELAATLREAAAHGHNVAIVRGMGGEFALRGMLEKSTLQMPARYVDTPPSGSDIVLDAADPASAMRLFKALQLVEAGEEADAFNEYVTFDLETTDNDVERCEIIEIGAARVRNGTVVERFHRLVRPGQRIAHAAREVHGYSDEDLRDAPQWAEVWPAFRQFVGGDLLVAHNAHAFDVPVLRRSSEPLGGTHALAFYDTLPLARSLYSQSARLVDLAARYGIDTGRSHHALDDAVTLAAVFDHLRRQRWVRSRQSAFTQALDYLALALVLRPAEVPHSHEERVLWDVSRVAALGRYSDCLEDYADERERVLGPPALPVEQVIDRLGGRQFMERLRTQRSPAERFPAAVERIQTLVEASHAPTLQESVGRLLERVTLSTSDGVEADPHRVNLFTLHATKGLEFSRVYLAGIEDYQIPGYYAVVDNREDEIQEARRLLYVGMTRAKDRLVMTRAESRFGRPAGAARFLDEIGLPAQRMDLVEQTVAAQTDGRTGGP